MIVVVRPLQPHDVRQCVCAHAVYDVQIGISERVVANERSVETGESTYEG